MTVNDSAVITVLAEIVFIRFDMSSVLRQLSPVAVCNQLVINWVSVDSVVREFACNKYNYMVYLKPETMQIPIQLLIH